MGDVYIWSLFKFKAIKHSYHREENHVFCLFANSNIILVFEISVLGPQFPVGKENSQPMCCNGNSLFPELFPFLLCVGGNDQMYRSRVFLSFKKLTSITLLDSDDFYYYFR